jgi:hypothetical protein
MASQWGRKETIIWPPHSPIYTYGAVLMALLCASLFVWARFTFGTTPLQQYYTPAYVRSAIGASFDKHDKYRLLFVGTGTKSGRLALDADVIEGQTPSPVGKVIPLTLSPAALALGFHALYRGPEASYPDGPFHAYLRRSFYEGNGFLDIYRDPLLLGAAAFVLVLPFSIRKDVIRRKQLKYGRLLKGPVLMTPEEFNAAVAGDGIGFKTDELEAMMRIPLRAEAQHVEIIGDTGSGKTTLILQMLRQIQGRGESAIIYDPACEFVRRFYDPKRGDIILNPLDKRCPYWGPSEELRRAAEADAISVSLFQPPQDKKGEFFIEIPQQIFAHLLQYKPTPKDLIEWMSNPKEIDRRVAGTEVANFIDRSAGPQRVGVLASLSKVAKSLRLLPEKGEGNGEWTATDWAETRQGWIFITSQPAEREALRPLQSVWIDLLVLRLLNTPHPEQKKVWFVLDELASLQRLPQLHTAITENRKSKNPLVLGFQGKAQLEVIYGHMAEVMLSQPATKIFLKTTEPKAAEWVSNAIGKIEIERMKETHYDGTRSGKNFTLDRQTEPLVMDSEIAGLADKHAFLKLGNNVARFSFVYSDIPSIAPEFIARPLAGDDLFRPKKPLPTPVLDEVEAPTETSQQTDGGPVAFAIPFSPVIDSREL